MPFPSGPGADPKMRLRLTPEVQPVKPSIRMVAQSPGPDASLPEAPTVSSRREPPVNTYDALAELFLGGDPAVAHARRSQERTQPNSGEAEEPIVPGTLDVELLILGHLPVRAGAWVEQYARTEAQESGEPVALLRVSGEDVALDLAGASLNGSTNGSTISRGLGEAMARAAGIARRMVLQVDEVEEPALAADPRVSAVTILCGVNEAAVVAAYRTIKALAGTWENRQASDPADGPRVRMAFMGAAEDEAEAAAEKLRRACATFLRQPVELAAAVRRISPGPRTSLFRGTIRGGAEALLDVIATAGSAKGPGTERKEMPARHSAPCVEPPARRLAHAGATDDDECLGGADEAPRLCRHMPGLRTLPVRWPDDERIEFAADASGVIHVLVQDEEGRGFERGAAAAAWAARHAALIAKASAEVPVSPRARPVIHLLTDRPKAFRHLLDAEVRVHVLAPVSASQGWYCAELN